MKFLRCFVTDLKRMIFNPYFAVGIIAVIFLCFASPAYLEAEKDREYNVFETFLKFRNEDIYNVSAQNISTNIQHTWLYMFIPIAAAFPFVNVICDELKNGAKRYYIYRTGVLSYSLSKVLSSLISSFVLCASAYLVYTGLVYIMFPSVYSMSEEQSAIFEGMSWKYSSALLSVALMGIASGIVTLLTAAFVRNKYFCLCIPFFVHYIRSASANKMFFDAYNSDNMSLVYTAQLISPSSITYLLGDNDCKLPVAVFHIITLLLVLTVFYISQKGRTDYGT